MQQRIIGFIFLGAVLVLTSSAISSAQTYYSNDFDTPEYAGPGISATLTGGSIIGPLAPYDSIYGNFLRNDSNTVATELTLTSLPIHTGVDVNFIAAFLDSWDSYDGDCCTPDGLDLYIDGTLVAGYTYNNALGSIKDIDGGALLYEYVQYDGNFFHSDTVVDMSVDPALSFPHSGSTLTVSFIASGVGWQGSTDEAYGIDNLSVDLSGVIIPEPASCVLLGLSLVGLMVRRR